MINTLTISCDLTLGWISRMSTITTVDIIRTNKCCVIRLVGMVHGLHRYGDRSYNWLDWSWTRRRIICDKLSILQHIMILVISGVRLFHPLDNSQLTKSGIDSLFQPTGVLATQKLYQMMWNFQITNTNAQNR